MSFVGTRPEATKYVEKYSNEMLATLLLPAGITSIASICYKDEAKLLDVADDVDYAMNIGISNAKGKYIIRLDAHADYSKNYISKCVYYLNTTIKKKMSVYL